MVPAMSGSNLSCVQGEKVKLRVSYGGAFIVVSGLGGLLAALLVPSMIFRTSGGLLLLGREPRIRLSTPGTAAGAGCGRQVELQGRQEPRGHAAGEL